MGGLSSVTNGLNRVISTASTINRAVSLGRQFSGQDRRDNQRAQTQALEQLAAQQRLEQQQAAQDVALERQKLAVQAADDERQRQDSLKRAVSRRRASLGAQGVSPDDGSGQAVLLGLFAESEAERQTRAELDSLRATALSQELSNRQARDLLRLTQLEEKNRLKRLSRFG